MSSRKKRRTGKRAKPTNKSPLPDLSPITEAFHDAYCAVWTAHQVLVEGDHGLEEGALRIGVELLLRVYEQLEEAEGELSRHRRGAGDES